MEQFNIHISHHWTENGVRHHNDAVSLKINASSDEYAKLFADSICSSMLSTKLLQNQENNNNESFDASVSLASNNHQ